MTPVPHRTISKHAARSFISNLRFEAITSRSNHTIWDSLGVVFDKPAVRIGRAQVFDPF
jgi:hypothetical protein